VKNIDCKQGGRWTDWLGWGTDLEAGRMRVRIPMGATEIFHWHNPSASLWPWGRLSL